MPEQLPTPILEIMFLNLFLGSITLLIGLGIIAFIIKRHGRFNWIKFFSSAGFVILRNLSYAFVDL